MTVVPEHGGTACWYITASLLICARWLKLACYSEPALLSWLAVAVMLHHEALQAKHLLTRQLVSVCPRHKMATRSKHTVYV